jgi:hypothetical protein
MPGAVSMKRRYDESGHSIETPHKHKIDDAVAFLAHDRKDEVTECGRQLNLAFWYETRSGMR